MKTITALCLAALAEAATPYGIESFDDVLEPLWRGIRSLRGKVRRRMFRDAGVGRGGNAVRRPLFSWGLSAGRLQHSPVPRAGATAPPQAPPAGPVQFGGGQRRKRGGLAEEEMQKRHLRPRRSLCVEHQVTDRLLTWANSWLVFK